MLTVRLINQLTFDAIQPLLNSSVQEGYGFIQRLWDEYRSGKNVFDAPGAVLLGVYVAEQLIAIGGVQPDPYLRDPSIGRIRHVYVLPDRRRNGIGQKLIEALIDHATDHFTTLTLRTTTQHGSAFYCALGFTTQPRFENATHWMEIPARS